MNGRFTSVLRPRHLSRLALGVVWIGVSCTGLALLAWYEAAPGTSRPAPRQWPAASTIVLSNRVPTLILFAHPRCPCTRASIGELEKIAARCQGMVAIWVVFFQPTGFDDDWDQTDLIETAEAIPSARVLRDPGGVEAHRFHATTSGQTLLYGTQGELLFRGGITLGRGHAGDNLGRSAIESYLTKSVVTCRETPVFGCPIAVSPE